MWRWVIYWHLPCNSPKPRTHIIFKLASRKNTRWEPPPTHHRNHVRWPSHHRAMDTRDQSNITSDVFCSLHRSGDRRITNHCWIAISLDRGKILTKSRCCLAHDYLIGVCVVGGGGSKRSHSYGDAVARLWTQQLTRTRMEGGDGTYQ